MTTVIRPPNFPTPEQGAHDQFVRWADEAHERMIDNPPTEVYEMNPGSWIAWCRLCDCQLDGEAFPTEASARVVADAHDAIHETTPRANLQLRRRLFAEYGGEDLDLPADFDTEEC